MVLPRYFPPRRVTPDESTREDSLQASDLLSYAQYEQHRGETGTAAELLSQVAASGPTEVASRAQARLDAISGEGGFSLARGEVLADQFVDQVMDPVALLAMTGAGATYRLARGGLLRSLAPFAQGLSTRGRSTLGMLASVGAFGVEATAFPLYTGLGSEALGHGFDWSPENLSHRIQSSFLVLGGLKLFGHLGQRSLQGWQRGRVATGGWAERILPTLVPQVSMYLGIVSGQVGERAIGLAPWGDAGQLLTESAVTLVHFNGMGRILGSVNGSDRLQALQRGALPPPVRARGLERLTPAYQEALAQLGRGEGGERQAASARQHVFMMEGNGEGDGGAPRESGSFPRQVSSEAVVPLARELSTEEQTEASHHMDRLIELFVDEVAPRTERGATRVDWAPHLGWLIDHPQAARHALIGRQDLSPTLLNHLAQGLGHGPFQPLTNPRMDRVLIANRGEIALRVARTLVSQRITPLVTVSESDLGQSWVARFQEMGGQVVPLRGHQASESYLDMDQILEAARNHQVDAVHPGYGFLSENPQFARRLQSEGLVLIGPSAETMARAGDKDVAKLAFQEAGVPVVPGTARGYLEVDGLIAELRELRVLTDGELIRPMRLKAVGGGGGRGQATVHSLEELRSIFPRLSREASAAFGNGAIMAEAYVPRFHHVEFQIMADRFGNVVHFGERECTLQERDQKIIEIHPASIFGTHRGLRERMADAAVRAARAVHYTGHGTVEFMVDPETGDFFAMEVNARIQVEHRVTELVNPGLDLIGEGIRVAQGEPLSQSQAEIQPTGAALEVRLKALAAGEIQEFSIGGSLDFTALEAEGIFVEATYQKGDSVNVHADPMLAKILVTAPNRAAAVQRAAAVLAQTQLRGSGGFNSDLARNLSLLKTRAVQEGLYDNHFVSRWSERGGEDLTQAPFRESRLLNDQVGVHLQVNSLSPLRPYRADALAWAMERLARGEESGDVFQIKGPVADLLRDDLSLYQEIFLGAPESRRVWAQTDGAGSLERLVLFEDDVARRVLIHHQVPWLNQERFASERPGSIHPTPLQHVVYDLTLPQQGLQPRVRLFLSEGPGMLREHLDLSPDFSQGPGQEYASFVQTQKEAGLVQIFPRTPLGLRISQAGLTAESALEIRDREGNILVQLSPSEVIRDQGERFVGLIELARSGIPRHHRQRVREQMLEILEEISLLPDLPEVRIVGVHLLDTMAEEMGPQLDAPGALRLQRLVQRSRDQLASIHHPETYLTHLEGTLRAVEALLQSNPAGSLDRTRGLLNIIPAMRSQVAHLQTGVSQRWSFIRQLGHTPVSIASEAIDRMGREIPTTERVLLDQIMTLREIEGEMGHHQLTGYDRLSEHMSWTRFVDRTGESPRSRLMLRAEANQEQNPNELDIVGESLIHLNQLMRRQGASEENVIQIMIRNPAELDLGQLENNLNLLYQAHRAVHGQANPLNLKRITFILAEPGTYPTYRTFRPEIGESGEATGRMVEDSIYRDTHPMLGRVLELHRLKDFDLSRDEQYSDRNIRLDSGRHRQDPRDFRLFASGTVPIAIVRRHGDGVMRGVVGLEANLLDTATRMAQHLEALPARQRPSWNRIFLNVQPRLEMSAQEIATELERVVNRHRETFDDLALEKIMVKVRVHESRAPGGTRTLLVKLHNPTRERYEALVRNVIQAPIANEAGQTRLREVLVPNRIYDLYLAQRVRDITRLPWDPADIPVRPRSELARRISRAWGQGRVYAYHLPHVIEDAVQSFRQSLGLRPMESSQGRGVGFTELDLDPRSIVLDEATGQINYNHGELVEVRRDPGQNEAGVVIGVHSADAGFNGKVKRVVIIGDLDHSSRGSLAAPETARINAALRYAEQEGLPVEWYAASFGAAILRPPAQAGVENLDATASTAREIVLRAHSRGVPINLVIMGTSIGAQSYWNALAGILHDTGGTITMLPQSSMSLTGPAALYAAMDRNVHALDLPAKTRSVYPSGLRSLAGYESIHGPNGDAMAQTATLSDAAARLMHHYYYSYTRPGQIVPRRSFHQDRTNRDITRSQSDTGQSVGEILQQILSGRASRGSREAILEALRDQGSPDALPWWEQVQGIQGQAMQNGNMPQRVTTLVQEMQIGGRPTLVIAPPIGPLTPGDSQLVARALWKANDRMPVVILGSLSGFNADPLSMNNGQLFGGASIAEAIVRHQGPITVVNLGIIVGGSFVVVSKQLNPHLRMLAVEGSRAQVIGGASAAKVVFMGEILRETEQDPRVIAVRQLLDALPSDVTAEQRADVEVRLEQVRREVIDELSERDAAEYDRIHSVERAVQVGAVDEMIAPSDLREAIIRHQEAGIQRYQIERSQRSDRALAESMRVFLANPHAAAVAIEVGIKSLLADRSMTLPQIHTNLRNLQRAVEAFQRKMINESVRPTPPPEPGDGSDGSEGSSSPT